MGLLPLTLMQQQIVSNQLVPPGPFAAAPVAIAAPPPAVPVAIAAQQPLTMAAKPPPVVK
jgi:hypothetical protein